jgi:Type IV pilin-like G and H, putative
MMPFVRPLSPFILDRPANMAYYFSKFSSLCLTIGMIGAIAVGCSQPSTTSVSPTPSSPVAIGSSGQSPSTLSVQPHPSEKPLSSPTATPSASAEASPLDANALKLSNKISKAVTQKGNIALQDTGKTFLSNLLLSQQAEHLTKGRFTGDLKRLAPDVPTDNEDYHLEVKQANESQAVLVAIAKKPGLNSYTGIVYTAPGKLPTTAMCRTNIPSQTPPQTPKFVQSMVMCPSGSSAIK